jgi:hypothetical protein
VINATVAPAVIRAVPREYLGRVFALVGPANRLGGIFSIAAASILVSTVLRGLSEDVLGVHIGRIDSVFVVAGIIAMLSGVYFAIAASRPAPAVDQPSEQSAAVAD